MEKNIIQNAIKCKKCHNIIASFSRHDYKTCGCDNETFIDGGGDYVRYGGVDRSDDSMELLTLYNTDTIEVMVDKTIWGTYGKDGKQPLKYLKLKECKTDHLEAIITNCKGISLNVKTVIKYILKERK